MIPKWNDGGKISVLICNLSILFVIFVTIKGDSLKHTLIPPSSSSSSVLLMETVENNKVVPSPSPSPPQKPLRGVEKNITNNNTTLKTPNTTATIVSTTSMDNEEKILSRRRRYLVFPEGSSIQMVFDETVPIVDYTLLFTVGVTIALAWELPSKPIYEEELMEEYESGSLPFINYRNDDNITDLNFINSTKYDDTLSPSSYNYSAFFPSNNLLYNMMPNHTSIDSYYFGDNNNYFVNASTLYEKQKPLRQSSSLSTPSNSAASNMKIDNINLNQNNSTAETIHNDTNDILLFGSQIINEILNFASETHEPWEENSEWDKKANKSNEPVIEINPGYPFIKQKPVAMLAMMGKRSLNTLEQHYQRFFMKHHRQTRYQLYKVIEKYMEANNFDGIQCILKTLCETGQKHRNGTERSFVEGIVHAVFRLPPADEIIKNHVHSKYHSANELEDDCRHVFSKCPISIWEAAYNL